MSNGNGQIFTVLQSSTSLACRLVLRERLCSDVDFNRKKSAAALYAPQRRFAHLSSGAVWSGAKNN